MDESRFSFWLLFSFSLWGALPRALGRGVGVLRARYSLGAAHPAP